MRDAWALRPPAFQSVPAFEHTFGPQVGRLCEQVGMKPDPEQQLVLDALFGVRDDARAAAFETAVIATRQQLKTGVLKMAALGWMFVTQEEFVTWSAHLFSTTQEAFRDLGAIVSSSPMLRRRMAGGPSEGVHGARGDQHLELRDGRRLAFRSRTKSGGRGLTGDKIILDEALYLEDEHMGSLIPTLTAVDDPQILYASSAGLVRSAILRDIRDRGRAGSDSLAYFEWGAPRQACASKSCRHGKPGQPDWSEGCALDDEALWRVANPLLGRRRANGTGLTVSKMRKFRMAEPPEEWMRERLGWWDEPGGDAVFGPGLWTGAATAFPSPMDFKLGAIGVAVSTDLSSSVLVGCGLRDVDGVQLPAAKVLAHGPGQGWVVEQARAFSAESGAPVLIARGSPASPLVDALRQAMRARLRVVTSEQYVDGCAELFVSVVDRQFQHADQDVLNVAVAAAERVDRGDRWSWSRRGAVDIAPLEALTLAFWGVRHGVRRSAADERLAAGGSAVLSI